MIKTRQSNIRTIKSGDPKFNIIDDFVTMPRAGFEINDKCPREYRQVIMTCIRHGYIKPVAYVKDTELFWEEFQK